MICKRSLCCLSCAFCHSRTRPFFFTLLQTSSHFTAQRSKSSRSRSPVTGSFASPNPPAAASEQQPGVDHRSAAALRSPRHGRSVRIRPPRLRSFRLAMIHGMPRYAMVCMFLTRFQYVSIVRPPMLSHIFSSQCFNVCYPDLFGHCKISFYNHHDTTFNNLYAMDLYYLYYLYYLLLSG